MANCHAEFQEFYDKIKLTDAKKAFLRTSRDSIRENIRKYFKNALKISAPNFRGQGSYAISTIINPLSGEYDVDDGVYLSNLDTDRSKWPSAETVHRWICNAVKSQTSQSPIDKKKCVRVVYAGQYHVDLPIYGMYNDKPYLAVKGETDWVLSDPKAVADWFNNKVKELGEQLRRIIRYLKAWADYKSDSGKLPCGLILTVLAVNNFVGSDQDDEALAKTAKNIYYQLLASPIICNPVNPSERLSDKLTESQMKRFFEEIPALINSADEALKEVSRQKAGELWQREFGNRFRVRHDKKESPVSYVLIANGGTKPWGKEYS